MDFAGDLLSGDSVARIGEKMRGVPGDEDQAIGPCIIRQIAYVGGRRDQQCVHLEIGQTRRQRLPPLFSFSQSNSLPSDGKVPHDTSACATLVASWSKLRISYS